MTPASLTALWRIGVLSLTELLQSCLTRRHLTPVIKTELHTLLRMVRSSPPAIEVSVN